MDSLFHTPSEIERQLPIYVTSVGHWLQQPIDRPEGFPDFHWMHTASGRGIVNIDGQTRPLPSGRGFFMFPHTPHSYHPDGEWKVMWLTFNGDVTSFLTAWGIRTGFVEVLDERRLSRIIDDTLYLAAESFADRSALARMSTLAYQFVVELIHQQSIRPRTRRARERLQPLLRYLDAHFAAPLTLRDMSEFLDVTPQHLCRMFKRVLGTTPAKYLIDVRIRKAKRLLLDDPLCKVSDVARAVGFESHGYFCSVFRRYARVTPSQYRGIHRKL